MNGTGGIAVDGARRARLLPFWETVPALLCDRRFEVLDATPLARALSPAFAAGTNLARFAFLSPDRDPEHPRWREMSGVVAGLLRRSLDQHDEDRPSERIVGELSAKSRDFSEAWADDETRPSTSGPIVFDDTPVGSLRMTYTLLKVPGGDGEGVILFAPADDASREAMRRLARGGDEVARR